MTNEEIQSKMNFIIEHQAQFAADIEMLKEAHTRGEERMTKIEDVVLRLANLTENNVNALNEKMAELAASQTNFNEKMSVLGERMTALADSQMHTDKRLDALIDIIRQERNGKRNS